jgi:RimJ/RimL family protein N-acetyltransferase
MNHLSSTVRGPAYRIHSSRLVIRCWEPVDAPLLKAALDVNIDHLLPWMPWVKDEPQELQQKVEWLRRCRGRFDLGEDFVYGIFNRNETQVVGGSGLHTRLGEGAREIGYWIHKDHINQGLATEVAAALTKVAFEIDHMTRVEIHCDPRNVRSASVPRNLGYTHEATLHNRVPDGEGNLRDSMVWTLFAQDYLSSLSASASIEVFDAAGREIR